MADSINSFRSHFDKFWSLHDFVYGMITELSHLLLEVQEIRFPYDRSYLWSCYIKVLSNRWKKRLQACFWWSSL